MLCGGGDRDGPCLEVEKAEVFRYEDDGGAIGVACHVSPGIAHIPIGERITRGSQGCCGTVAQRLRGSDG